MEVLAKLGMTALICLAVYGFDKKDAANELAHFIGLLTAVIILSSIWQGGMNYDSTDDKASKNRSGLRIYVDHKTGVQYLGTIMGSLTPRVDRDGNIMTVENDK